MDDTTGIRIALVASIAAVLISVPTAAAWLARGYESLAAVSVLCIGVAAVSVLCIGVAIVSAGFSLVLRSARRPS